MTFHRFVQLVMMSLVCVSVPSTFGQEFNGQFKNLKQVPGVNSQRREETPFVTTDGLSIYFASNRENPPSDLLDFTQMDIWVAHRESTDERFAEPTKLPAPINTDGLGDLGPVLSDDGKRLYFFTGSGPGTGDGEIWISERNSVTSDTWSQPTEVAGLDSDAFSENVIPRFAVDELSVVFSSAEIGSEDYDIFEASRATLADPFGNIVPIDAVNTNLKEVSPTMSSDGRLLLYNSATGPFGFDQLHGAVRSSRDEAFSLGTPFNELELGLLNTSEAAEFSPILSRDWPAHGSKLYFIRAFTGDDWDIYEATWYVDGCDRPNELIGDLDGDGTVGFSDFLALSANFGSIEGILYSGGDVDCDGSINFADFLALSANFGNVVMPSAQAVPEPNAMSLCLMAFVCVSLATETNGRAAHSIVCIGRYSRQRLRRFNMPDRISP